MKALVSRLLTMDRREVAFRAGVTGRALGQRVVSHVRHARWDWNRLDTILARPLRLGSRARVLPLHPQDAATLPGIIRDRFPGAEDAARAAGDLVINGHLSLLGFRDVPVGSDIDWHFDPVHGLRAPRKFWSVVPYLNPAFGDHKIIWEINRQQHFLTLGRAFWLTGNAVYAREIVKQMDSWLDQNPPLTGINWASMLELGFRSLSWLWAMQFLLAREEEHDWLPRMLIALDAQLEHVRHNLSRYFSPNTHLLGEALALYVAGRALPELAHAHTWTSCGRTVLIEQTDRQVLEDGGHAELSAHYHRYALDFYLLALSVARLSGDAGAAEQFEAVARRMARFARTLADARGYLPLIGDDDGGQLFPICRREPADVRPTLAWAAALLRDPTLVVDRGSVPEEVYWLCGGDPHLEASPPRPPDPISLAVFPDAGYVIGSTSRGDHAVIDVGRLGFLNGGHAHADALSCVVSFARKPLLIDPGTSTYTMDPALRDRMRASSSHNTVTLDGRLQSEPAGPFHWRTRADATLLGAVRLPHALWMAGQHNAYAPLVHRRDVVMTDDGLILFIDWITGDTAAHVIELRWTLDRAWDYHPARSCARLTHTSGAEARVTSTVDLEGVRAGADAGWCAPVYGQLLPTCTLIGRLRGRLPVQAVTAFADTSVPPSLRAARTASGVSVFVGREGHEDMITVGPSGPSHERMPRGVAVRS